MDSTTSRNLSQATVTLVVWRKKESGDDKVELQGKTDEQGFVEFSNIEANRIAVTVTMKGFRPYWRWMHTTDRRRGTSTIKLVPWISMHK